MHATPAPPEGPRADGRRPRVLAVLVAHDGARWLPTCLDALGDQTYPALDVLAVDNGSDDESREILLDRLGPDRVLLAERDVGFGRAVAMALDTALAREAAYVVLVHDDVALDPEATARLVEHLERFEDVAVAGAKKVDWDDPVRLQAVGWSVDVTGRAHSGLESDELDQGQHDQVRRCLYVSTSGMLVRREVFEQLGGFDRRYHLFRDDLDLCWRVWLAGHQVEVVPSARVRHAASASNYERLGQTAFLGPRYFAERNTLATLLKTYSLPRLATVIPLFFVVGILKVLGFLATRRLGDAWQTVRAWLWNVLHLRETWRLRRRVQALRRVPDAELRPLFARVVPRARAYLEAIVDWATGGGYAVEGVPPVDEADQPSTITHRIVAAVRRHPVGSVAGTLAVFGLVVALPVLQPGTLRGGELMPWPSGPMAFLADYVSGWHDVGAAGTAAAPSPAQALLGVLDIVLFSADWLAPRLLLLGALPLAWLLTLRATAVVTGRRIPRVAAATAYVLSPPVVAALQTGRVSALVVAVGTPALGVALAPMLSPDAEPSTAWRATAAAALIGAGMIAFAPPVLFGLAAGVVVAVAAVAGMRTTRSHRRAALVRVAVAVVGMPVLLLPWSVRLLAPDGPLFGRAVAVEGAGGPFWRWLLLTPDAPGFPPLLAGVGFVAAGALGIALAFRRHPVEVASLWAVALGGIFAGWGLDLLGRRAFAWVGLPLLLSAAAFAALLALALSSAGAALSGHDFGWRQVAGGVTSAAVLVGLVASGTSFLGSPWSAFTTDEPSVPAFVASETETVGPFRVLVLDQRDGRVRWDLIAGGGPTMASYGVPVADALVREVEDALVGVLGGADPGAAGTLGLLNVRYVLVPPDVPSTLTTALSDQLALEPQPVAAGRVYRVRGWLPRVAWLPSGAAGWIRTRGELPRTVEPTLLGDVGGGGRSGVVPGPGVVAVSEVEGRWVGTTAEGRSLDSEPLGPVVGLPVAEGVGSLQVEPAGAVGRSAALALQVVLVLLAVSLMLRPPRFARRGRSRSAPAAEDPGDPGGGTDRDDHRPAVVRPSH